MTRACFVAALLAVLAAPVALAQAGPKVSACDTASVLAQARPIFGVGAATLRNACPAFSRAIWDEYQRTLRPTLGADQRAQIESLLARWAGAKPVDTAVTATLRIVNRFVTTPRGVEGRWVDTLEIGRAQCVFAIATDSLGRVRTGRPVTFSSSDPRIAAFGGNTAGAGLPPGLSFPAVCPDTTIDPRKLRWSTPPPVDRSAT